MPWPGASQMVGTLRPSICPQSEQFGTGFAHPTSLKRHGSVCPHPCPFHRLDAAWRFVVRHGLDTGAFAGQEGAPEVWRLSRLRDPDHSGIDYCAGGDRLADIRDLPALGQGELSHCREHRPGDWTSARRFLRSWAAGCRVVRGQCMRRCGGGRGELVVELSPRNQAFCRISPLRPTVTRTFSALATWLAAVPRSWRTPSVILFMPWI